MQNTRIREISAVDRYVSLIIRLRQKGMYAFLRLRLYLRRMWTCIIPESSRWNGCGPRDLKWWSTVW